MKIREFMDALYRLTDSDASHYGHTCDTLKAGDPEQPFNGRVASTMFPTPDVIRAAKEWGAGLLIVHEPTYYDHWDSPETFAAQTGFKRRILDLKKKLIDESGLVIYRYHDHPHYREKDMISMGEVGRFGLKGRGEKGTRFGLNEYVLDEPMTPLEIAKTLEKNLDIKHVRIIGSREFPAKRLLLSFGAAGGVETELDHCDVVLAGEICEWMNGEFVRDCAALGINRALLVMGHSCSEREGMRLLTDVIRQNWPEVEAKYFESGDVCTYTD